MTVYKMLRAGDLRAVKVGGEWRVREADLDEFVRSLPAVRLRRRPNRTGGVSDQAVAS